MLIIIAKYQSNNVNSPVDQFSKPNPYYNSMIFGFMLFSLVQVSSLNLSFGPKQNTKLTLNHPPPPPTHPKLFNRF